MDPFPFDVRIFGLALCGSMSSRMPLFKSSARCCFSCESRVLLSLGTSVWLPSTWNYCASREEKLRFFSRCQNLYVSLVESSEIFLVDLHLLVSPSSISSALRSFRIVSPWVGLGIGNEEERFSVGFSPPPSPHLPFVIRTRKRHCSDGEDRAGCPVSGDPRLCRQILEWLWSLSRSLRLDTNTGSIQRSTVW